MAERPLFLRAYEGRVPFAKRRLLLLIAAAFIGLPLLPSTVNDAEAVSASPSMVCVANVCTWTFPYTGDYYEWTVPAGMTRVGFDVQGAEGGGGRGFGVSTPEADAPGGRGGRVTGELAVTPGAVLRIYVGGKGATKVIGGPSSTGGFNGGGGTNVSAYAQSDTKQPGEGGGASDIRTTSSLANRVVVAGGGGGGGGYYYGEGGAGGGLTGQRAQDRCYQTCATGGTQSVGGTSPAGGTGALGVGARGTGGGHGGGGGGGGYYGGGGGWVGPGAGGSSYTSPTSATAVVHTQGHRLGNGLVVLTMLRPGVASFGATVSSPTNQSSSLTYNLQFSEAVTGLDQSEISLSGTSTGWAITSFGGSGADYTVGLTGTSVTSGSISLTVAQDAVTSTLTGQTGPTTASASAAMTIDLDPPTASVSSSPSSPAAAVSLTFGLAFSESVSGIASADFSNAGTAVGCVFTPSAATGSSVNVVVTQCQEGTLLLRLAQNSVTDAAGNTGPVSALDSSTVTLAASSLTVTAGDKSVNFGGSWTDSYSQTGLLGSDSITVTYSYSGTSALGSSYGPSATKPTSGGTYSIIPSVSYGAGNANRYALVRNNGTLSIARVAQAALTVSTTTATFGQTLSLASAGGSGTGAVTWSKVSGTCSVTSGGSLTPGDAGSTCVVQATKAADDNYLQVTSSNTSVSTNKANQAGLTVTSTNATYGETLSLVASGGSGTGAVTWSKVSGTCSVTSGGSLTPGDAGSSCVVRASKATDTNYNQADSANRTITIDKASQTGFSISSASSFTTGSTHTLTASGGQTSGTVTWSVTSGNCVLSGTSLTSARGGVTCGLSATRAGDSNYLPSTDTMTVTVNKITQVLTFRSTVPATANPGGTYTVSVDSDASLAPTLAIANSSSSVCSVSAGVVTFNAVGTCLISASQAGNDTYSSAAASQTVTVTAVAAAAPASTVPVVVPTVAAPPATVSPAATVAPTTTTIPVKGSATTVPRPAPTTTTTTTTTTLPPRQDSGAPNAGADGKNPELAQGETTALVRGKKVKVDVEQTDGQVVMKLPNKVTLRIGTTDPSAKSAQVNAEGVLVAYRGETIMVTAEGFVPGTTYTVYMFSEPVELGRGEASPAGEVSAAVEVPVDVKTGGHTLQVNGVGAGDEVVSVSLGFKVTERQDNTRAVVIALTLAVLLALLGGRPVFRRRRSG